MPPVTDYGTAYLDAESFRTSAALFGVGMSMCEYPSDSDGNAKLNFVLQAASRTIDAFCARDFSPDDHTEQHSFDRSTWQFVVNNPPVTSISSCTIRYGKDGTLSIPTANVYINNQKRCCEITRSMDGTLVILDAMGTELIDPQVEVVYKSVQDIPKHVQLACGFQAGHLINSGFVDKTLPPNFGKIEMSGLSINNKKGYRSSEEMSAGSFSPDAQRLLIQGIKFSIA
jgi:hypothetical protein